MREMKDSGVDWIGEIPAHWEVKRFKAFAKTIKGKSYDTLNEPFDGSYKVLSVECLRQDEAQFYDYVFVDDENQICTSNDIVVIWDGAGVGEFLKAKDGVLSSTIAKIQLTNKSVILPYLWYWRYKVEYRLKSIPTGMGIPHLNPTLLNNFKIAIPPIEEQQAIADYLDEKTAEIDEQISLLEQKQKAYVNLKQSLISQVVTRGLNPTAELKDSGIEWIGKIPAHWEIRRLKDVSSFVNGYAFDSNDFETDDGIKVIRIGDIGQSVDFENCARAKTDSALLSGYKINDGDILLAMSGATTGKTCIVYNPQEAFINQRVGIIRSKMSKMIFYLLQTPYFLEFINLYNTGSAQPNISSKDVGEFPIIVVPAEERQMLTDYLDKKTAEIDEQISNIDKKINTYKRLKQSLIDEVVTGKRKI